MGELVSGFNTEYSSVLFVMVFLAEYIAIILMSVLCSMLFLAASYAELLVRGITIGFFYVWARGTLPRFRYDQLMYLAWKVFLPLSLLFLMGAALLYPVALSFSLRPTKSRPRPLAFDH